MILIITRLKRTHTHIIWFDDFVTSYIFFSNDTDFDMLGHVTSYNSASLPSSFTFHDSSFLFLRRYSFRFCVSAQLIYVHIDRITFIYTYTYIQRYFLRFPLTASNRLGTFSKENTLPPSFLLSFPARNSRASDDLELSPFLFLSYVQPPWRSPYLSSSSARVCSRDGRCTID